jgi:chromate transport protein ChrA
MTNFLFDLLSNLALLAIVSIACRLYNRFGSGAVLSGPAIFIMLALIACVLDGLLTFLVFADAQSRYGQFARPTSFLERAGAYALAIVIALSWHRMTRRRRAATSDAHTTVVIHTSPYSESRLRM